MEVSAGDIGMKEGTTFLSTRDAAHSVAVGDYGGECGQAGTHGKVRISGHDFSFADIELIACMATPTFSLPYIHRSQNILKMDYWGFMPIVGAWESFGKDNRA